MKFYKVGGYVRDTLMGRKPQDTDWLVVGATPEDMIAEGFVQVGADFPVFLHPNGDEYALARTERKVAAGYNGFETSFDQSVTIEEDLKRRDLTINAMAMGENGLVDLFGGQNDIKNGILRHVSEAFAEDPLRVLRVARFRARYNFYIAPETMELMISMVNSGEVDHLTKERIWAEFQRALMEKHPELFFKTLSACGALERVFGNVFDPNRFGLTYSLQNLSDYDATFDERMIAIGLAADEEGWLEFQRRVPVPDRIVRLVEIAQEVLVIHDNHYSWKDHELYGDAVLPGAKPVWESMFNILNKYRMWNREVSDLSLVLRTLALLGVEDRLWTARYLLRVHELTHGVNFASLSHEDQTFRTGKEIGEAINKIRLNIIIEYLNPIYGILEDDQYEDDDE